MPVFVVVADSCENADGGGVRVIYCVVGGGATGSKPSSSESSASTSELTVSSSRLKSTGEVISTIAGVVLNVVADDTLPIVVGVDVDDTCAIKAV